MKRLTVVFMLSVAVSACDLSSSTPAPAPMRTLVGLKGTVSATGVGPVDRATIEILDGPNAGQTTTSNSAGAYAFAGLTPGNANLSANAGIYDELRSGVNINGVNTLDFVFPVPSCRANNTATVTFGNRSASTTQDVIWDGLYVATLAPGQTSYPFTETAGVQHTLTFLVAGTSKVACSPSALILTQCEKGHLFTCAAP